MSLTPNIKSHPNRTIELKITLAFEWIRKNYINIWFILQISKRSAFLFLKDTFKKWLTLPNEYLINRGRKQVLFYSWYMPPSLGTPIQGPNFYSINFSLWGLPHQLSVPTNFHPVPSVRLFQLDKKQKVPKQSEEWGECPQSCRWWALTWGARTQAV